MSVPGHLPVPRCQAAFSLLELLVVLVVISLTITIIGPRLVAGMPAASLRGATAELVAGLQRARSRALAENRPIAVVLKGEPAGLVVAGRHRELRGVRLRVPDDETLPRTMYFHPDGSSDGLIVHVVAGDSRQRVSVDWLSGRIRVAERVDGDG